MSSSTPPGLPDQPSALRRHGCLIFVVAIVALLFGGALVLYHVAVGTAVPYRIFAAMIEKANPNVHIEGITGDLTSGLGISSITWGDVPGSPSEILDLRVRYNGYGDAGKTHRLVLNEVGVRRAHIDLADFPSTINTTTMQTTTVTSGSSSTIVTTTTSGPHISTTTSTSSPAFPAGAAFPAGLSSIEIERVSLEDVVITNRQTPDFRISIPKIEWTGFKVTPNSVEPGVLTIESDRLVLHTTPGRTLPLEGQNVTFQKLLTVTAQPALHPAIKQPVAFTADLSFLPQGDVLPFHLATADGKLEISGTKEGGGSVHARQLDLAGLIDPKKIFGENAGDFPSDLVLDAVAAPGFSEGSASLTVAGGRFHLGVSTFEIQHLEFNKTEQAAAVLQAVTKSDGKDITWVLPLVKIGDEYRPSFISAGMEPTDILARVFVGKPYQELSGEEKQAVDARLPVYFPPAEK